MNPLQGLIRDAWRLYRSKAVRLIAVAAVIVLPAMGADYLIYGSAGSGAWSLLIDLFAAWLVLGIVARIITGRPTATGRPSRRQLAAVIIRPLACAATLAAIPVAARALEPVTGPFEAMIAVPVLAATFMWLLAMPVIVTERTGPLAALRRSWQLIRGHVWDLLGALVGAWAVLIAFMIIPIAVASIPALAASLHTEILRAAEDIVYGPFLAVVLALTYRRLAQAGAARTLKSAPLPCG